jgi:hypothetical protein
VVKSRRDDGKDHEGQSTMNANDVAGHEVDGRCMPVLLERSDDYIAALGAELADLGPARELSDLVPARSHAFCTAVALLSVYRSRIDFLGHRALDTGDDNLRYRFAPMPGLTGPDPDVTH